MQSTAVSANPAPEPGLFSAFLEESTPDALLRELPSDDQETPALRTWFVELLRLCHRSGPYARILASAASFLPGPGAPAFSMPLAVTPSHRLSLLGIHPTKPIPLHDHPEAWSAQMVVSGRTSIHHCNCLENSTLPLLESVSVREFGPHGISSTTPAARNIHTLAANTANAVLLSIQTPPSDTVPRSWFFPLEPSHRPRPLLRCRRIGIRHRDQGVGKG